MGSSMTRNAFVAAARILTREQMLAAFVPLDGKDPTWIEVLLSEAGDPHLPADVIPIHDGVKFRQFACLALGVPKARRLRIKT